MAEKINFKKENKMENLKLTSETKLVVDLFVLFDRQNDNSDNAKMSKLIDDIKSLSTLSQKQKAKELAKQLQDEVFCRTHDAIYDFSYGILASYALEKISFVKVAKELLK